MTTPQVTIIVNGRKFAVHQSPLSFRDIADFVGLKSPVVPTITVSTRSGGRSVLPGESVMPIEGMVFNAYDTSKA